MSNKVWTLACRKRDQRPPEGSVGIIIGGAQGKQGRQAGSSVVFGTPGSTAGDTYKRKTDLYEPDNFVSVFLPDFLLFLFLFLFPSLPDRNPLGKEVMVSVCIVMEEVGSGSKLKAQGPVEQNYGYGYFLFPHHQKDRIKGA